MESKTLQINGFTIMWSTIYSKWIVFKGLTMYAMFKEQVDAVLWTELRTIRKITTVNGYKIKWSRTYNKWSVSRKKVVYEEFREKTDAIDWAINN